MTGRSRWILLSLDAATALVTGAASVLYFAWPADADFALVGWAMVAVSIGWSVIFVRRARGLPVWASTRGFQVELVVFSLFATGNLLYGLLFYLGFGQVYWLGVACVSALALGILHGGYRMSRRSMARPSA